MTANQIWGDRFMEKKLPYIVTAESNDDIQSWTNANRSWIDKALDDHGAILLRSFRISSEPEFRALVNAFSIQPLQYIYGSTPRTSLGGGIYTATEYPSGLTIPQHNENAYQREWPLRLLFFCEQPATGGGGQTPLADSLKVTQRIPASIQKRFNDKKVMYIRNYRKGIDLPWQTVFQTESKTEVEGFCRSHDIFYEWTGPDSLRTRQICQAFAQHPRTGVTIWFNQAHLFHPSSLDKRTRAAMREMLAEEDFPRTAAYGDGSPLDERELEDIREAFKQEIVTFQWQAKDVLIVDNMLVSHGRTPYKGKRRVLVGMYDRFSSERGLEKIDVPSKERK
jgi:alpha-ketoglutarate-dependent taurine dioxygenase